MNGYDTNVLTGWIPVYLAIQKNTERHTAHTIVSWPNPKQWVIVHTPDLMMITIQSIYIYILSIITREMGQLKTHSPTYPIQNYVIDTEGIIRLTQCPENSTSSLWLIDAIWRHRSGSTLAEVMDWCLTAPSYYLIQCWFIIRRSYDIHLRTLPKDDLTKLISVTKLQIRFLKSHTDFTGANKLTHWGPVCVSKQTIIDSDNGLSSGRRQAIICTNAGI